MFGAVDHMTTELLLKLLQDLGGIGLGAVFFWMWKQERDERRQKQASYEALIGTEIPELASTLKELAHEVRKRGLRSNPPGPA